MFTTTTILLLTDIMIGNLIFRHILVYDIKYFNKHLLIQKFYRDATENNAQFKILAVK